MTSAIFERNLAWLNFSILLRSSDLDLFSPFFPSDLQIGLGQNGFFMGLFGSNAAEAKRKNEAGTIIGTITT